VNATESPISGTIRFISQAGSAAVVSVNGQQGSEFGYNISARGSAKFKTSGLSIATQVGSVRIIPVSGASPSAQAIFSFAPAGTTVTAAGVPGVTGGTAFRLYAEAFGRFENGVEGTLQTGLAVTNLSNASAQVNVELYLLNGMPSGMSATLALP